MVLEEGFNFSPYMIASSHDLDLMSNGHLAVGIRPSLDQHWQKTQEEPWSIAKQVTGLYY